jgi:hypothetical protein
MMHQVELNRTALGFGSGAKNRNVRGSDSGKFLVYMGVFKARIEIIGLADVEH